VWISMGFKGVIVSLVPIIIRVFTAPALDYVNFFIRGNGTRL
jgi:hypothetical protein